MSTPLTIVAKMEAKDDKVDLLKSELAKLIDVTRKEDGCIKYDLHQDNTNPAVFLFFEVWENRDKWQDHMANDHLKEFTKNTNGAIKKSTLNEMTIVK